MRYSDRHRKMRTWETEYTDAIKATDENKFAEIPPRIMRDHGMFTEVYPYGGMLAITGSLALIFGLGAFSYARKRDWTRGAVCGLLCAGSVYLTYYIACCYAPDNDR